ncbi:MAG: hypothetical protein KC931_21610, partial [Candidatus Omnitrophica bacterium]|nr:hypothetical protein [Candidatus Omnitrophota bacterium]
MKTWKQILQPALIMVPLFSCLAFGQPEEGYYRYPTIHGDTIAFVAEDDLWTVPATGGTAMRLTTTLSTVAY